MNSSFFFPKGLYISFVYYCFMVVFTEKVDCSGLVGEVLYTRHGFTYSCLNTLGNLALIGVGVGPTTSHGFEVWFLVPVKPSDTRVRNRWGLVFPSDEHFGYVAWSYQYQGAALRKIEQLKGGS